MSDKSATPSSSIAIIPPNATAPAIAREGFRFTGKFSLAEREMLWAKLTDKAIERTKHPTVVEFEEFIYKCESKQLDPFLNLIYFKKERTGTDYRATHQTSIDGLRLQAERTGKYAPGPEPTYEHTPQNKLVKATAYVMKRTDDGTWHTVSDHAYYEEFVQKKGDGTPNRMWATMAHSQTAKCAESKTLRRAFPAECAGLYTTEEMGQAENQTTYGEAAAAQQASEPKKSATASNMDAVKNGTDKAQKAAPAAPTPAAAAPASKANPVEKLPPATQAELGTAVKSGADVPPPKPKALNPSIMPMPNDSKFEAMLGVVVEFQKEKDGKPLATGRGSQYVRLKLKEVDGYEPLGPRDSVFCYHKSLFTMLEGSLGAEVELVFSKTIDDKRRIWQSVEDVLRIGKVQYQDGQPAPTEADLAKWEAEKNQAAATPAAAQSGTPCDAHAEVNCLECIG